MPKSRRLLDGSTVRTVADRLGYLVKYQSSGFMNPNAFAA
jgi:hypothetical protein